MKPLRLLAAAVSTAALWLPQLAASQSVSSFTVVNADTGADIATFTSSGTVSIAATPRISVRANASNVKSVVFTDGNLPSALPFIKDKRLIAIVVAAPNRLASLPDVPTFAEVGLAPVNRMSFLRVSAPRGTPKDVLDKLNAAVRTALADVAVKGRTEAAGASVVQAQKLKLE
jgi:Tripartite tricarboxylate transporter family receptor